MTVGTSRRRRPWLLLLALFTALAVVASACGSDDDDAASDDGSSDDGSSDDGSGDDGSGDDGSGDDGSGDDGGNEGTTLRVALVGNPQIEQMGELAAEFFTPETGIEVELNFLDEGTLREVTTRDVAAGGDQFDIVQIGMYETPQFGAAGWLTGLNQFIENDPDYNVDDLIPAVRDGLSVDGELYSAPVYAESSHLMYRADVLEAAGLEMPAAPTWEEVAEIARAVDSDDMAGICLRGKAGWGDLGASFTTVLNTYGGTWWLADGDNIGAAQVDQPEFADAFNFYVDLINDAGQDDPATSSFPECLSLYQAGEVAMWYDATVAASILEADDSPVKGLNGYALAPTNVTDASGWLWAWTMAIPANNENPEAAWEFISWATGPDYVELAATELDGGWAGVPPGTRQSTYDRPEYQEAAAAFAQPTLDAMIAAPINSPGVDPRPGLPGVQFVGVPQFQDMGNRCTEQLSSAIGGSTSVDDAIAACQDIASEFEGESAFVN